MPRRNSTRVSPGKILTWTATGYLSNATYRRSETKKIPYVDARELFLKTLELVFVRKFS